MTKNGSFKRAVRAEARSRGRRYTEALAEFRRRAASPFAEVRPFDPNELKRHFEERYGMRIESLAPIDDDPRTRPNGSWPGHYPWTLVVRRSEGRPWIARVFSSPADSLERVSGDAGILRFLASSDFPAERIAHEEPVSEFQGRGVIVTEFLEGGRPADAAGRVESAAVFHELGALLGRLHALPASDGATARDGGSEEHDGGFHIGRPKEDLATAMGFLVDVESALAPNERPAFELLRSYVENCDDAEGLPEALTHGNFHAWAAVGEPGRLSIVGWAGSGRGPRLPAVAWLLTTAAEASPEFVDATMRGYREHVELTDAELQRLPAVMRMRPLWLACLDYRQAVRNGTAPVVDDGWTPPWSLGSPDRFEQIAARAASAARS